jgi:hypothetical protein
MISQKELLNIVCTEAIEHGGLQEVPGQQHGGNTAFFAAKRPSRGGSEKHGTAAISKSPSIKYGLRLVKKADGTLEWKD